MASKTKQWYCVRQRAGPLVKECRAIRPRLSRFDNPYERLQKNKILRPPRDSSVCRTPVDRMELLLALFGFDGYTYVLEWPDETRPPTFDAVRRRLDALIRRMREYHGGPFDYIYRIEGLHGHGHYHLHLVVSYSDFNRQDMERLWPEGSVEWAKPLLLHGHDTYRRTAIYLMKERNDGMVIPVSRRAWGASRSLTKRLPAPERFTSDTGQIDFPKHPRACGRSTVDNEWGHYHYGWYIKQDPKHFVM